MLHLKNGTLGMGALALSIALLTGCGGDSSSGGGSTATFSAASYYATNCASCHGANGEGTQIASALNDDDESGMVSTMKDIRNNVTSVNGYSSMEAYFPDSFTDTQINALASYIFDTFNTPAPAPTFDAAAFYTSKCVSCHGSNAEGVSGLGNNLQGYSETELASIMKRIKSGDSSVDGFSSMSTLFTTTSETNIDSAAKYIADTF